METVSKTPAAQEADALAAEKRACPPSIPLPNVTPQSPATLTDKPDRAKASKAELLSIAAILRVLEKLPPEGRGRVLKYVVDLESPSL